MDVVKQISANSTVNAVFALFGMSCMHECGLTEMQALLIGELTSTSEVLPPPHFEVRAA
jgi:hypothetical protein